MTTEERGWDSMRPRPNQTAKIDRLTYCQKCGWPVVWTAVNDAMAVDPLYMRYDYWSYCSSKSCEFHAGEGHHSGMEVPSWTHRMKKDEDGNPIMPKSGSWTEPPNPPLRPIREAAYLLGYAVAVHGSEQRDYDLIAVPWTAAASTWQDLVASLTVAANAVVVGDITLDKPHGRISCILQVKDRFMRHIDLSIMPTVKGGENV